MDKRREQSKEKGRESKGHGYWQKRLGRFQNISAGHNPRDLQASNIVDGRDIISGEFESRLNHTELQQQK